MDASMKIFQEMDDLKAGLKDTAKSLAEEFDVKPALLMKAARTAYKSNLNEQKEELDSVDMLLMATGRGVL